MTETLDLREYRRVVARHRRAALTRRRRFYCGVADAYCRDTGQTVYAIENVIAWGRQRGLLTTNLVLDHVIEDATHGYLEMLRRCSKTGNLPFLLHPARLVRAVQAALADGDDADLRAAVETRWRALSEAGDAPFPWHRRLVEAVAAAVRWGELRDEAP